MTKSMWAQYREELDGGKVIEVEGGFIAFRTLPDWDNIFISDCFVHPDFRHSGIGKRLFEQVCSEAKKLGKACVVTSIDVATNTAVTSLSAQLAVGLVPFLAESGKIWLRKFV